MSLLVLRFYYRSLKKKVNELRLFPHGLRNILILTFFFII